MKGGCSLFVSRGTFRHRIVSFKYSLPECIFLPYFAGRRKLENRLHQQCGDLLAFMRVFVQAYFHVTNACSHSFRLLLLTLMSEKWSLYHGEPNYYCRREVLLRVVRW